MVGRYPEKTLPDQPNTDTRTVDVLDAESGAMVTRLSDPGARGIVSVSVSTAYCFRTTNEAPFLSCWAKSAISKGFGFLHWRHYFGGSVLPAGASA